MEPSETIRALLVERDQANDAGLVDRVVEINEELQEIANRASTPAARSSKRPTPISIARR